MIHLALLILAACIVIPFFIALVAGGMYLVSRFWYVFVIVFIAGWIWIDRINTQNAESFKQASAVNSSLQQQCKANAAVRYQQLVKSQPPTGYTYQTYQDGLRSAYIKVSNDCVIKYPIYSTK